MRYYKHNIGDYAAATTHLTIVEDGFYRRLLDLYYLTETPLPPDLTILARRVRVRGGGELIALKRVLGEFFTLEADGYHQRRCDDELGSLQHVAASARRNGSRGGRPTQDAKSLQDNETPKPERLLLKTNPVKNKKLPTTHYPLPTKDKKESSPQAASFMKPAREAAAAASAPLPALVIDNLDLPPHLDRRGDKAFEAYAAAAEANGWPTAMILNSTRRYALQARLNSCGGLPGWRIALEAAAIAGFLKGRDGRIQGWFDIDWLLKEQNFTRLMEGRYAERRNHHNDQPDERSTSAALAGIAEAGSR